MNHTKIASAKWQYKYLEVTAKTTPYDINEWVKQFQGYEDTAFVWKNIANHFNDLATEPYGRFYLVAEKKNWRMSDRKVRITAYTQGEFDLTFDILDDDAPMTVEEIDSNGNIKTDDQPITDPSNTTDPAGLSANMKASLNAGPVLGRAVRPGIQINGVKVDAGNMDAVSKKIVHEMNKSLNTRTL